MARVTKRGYPTMTTSAEHPAQPKADSEPPSSEFDAAVATGIRWARIHKGLIYSGLVGIVAFTGWVGTQVISAIEKRVDPVREAVIPLKAADADHDRRLTIIETKVGEIHADVREIRRHILNGSHAKKSEP